jgi:hypothetical protein
MSQPPQRRRSPLLWLLVAGGGIAVASLVFALTGGPDTSSPEGVVEAAAEALGDDDVDDLQRLACDRVDLRADFTEVSVGSDPSARVQSAEAEEVVGGHSETGGMGMIKLTYTDGSTRSPFVFLDKVNDSWCVSKLVHA